MKTRSTQFMLLFFAICLTSSVFAQELTKRGRYYVAEITKVKFYLLQQMLDTGFSILDKRSHGPAGSPLVADGLKSLERRLERLAANHLRTMAAAFAPSQSNF